MYNINPQLRQTYAISQKQDKNGSNPSTYERAVLLDANTKVKWNVTGLLRRLRPRRVAIRRRETGSSQSLIRL